MDKEIFNTLTVDEQVDYINSKLKEEFTLRDIIERELNLPRSTIRNRFTRNKYVFNKRLYRYIKITNQNESQCLSLFNKEGASNDIREIIDKKYLINKAVNFNDKETLIDNKESNVKNLNNDNFYDLKEKEMNNSVKSNIDIDAKLNELRKKIKSNLQFSDDNMNMSSSKPIEENETLNCDLISENKTLNCDLISENKEDNTSLYLKENEINELREFLKYKDDILRLIKKSSQLTTDCKCELKLQGEIKVKMFKIYDNILSEFDSYIRRHKEMRSQDIISLALKEFLEKHN